VSGGAATIYVALCDEGVDVWRPVIAQRVGDFFRISGEIPNDEWWEFQPGQLVRCQTHQFENGVGLVAVEAVAEP